MNYCIGKLFKMSNGNTQLTIKQTVLWGHYKYPVCVNEIAK